MNTDQPHSSAATPLNPSSVSEAQDQLEQIAARVAQLQNEYQQLQLQAAWLQGWIANQSNGSTAATTVVNQTTPKPAKKRKS